jgi:hypothetical protein
MAKYMRPTNIGKKIFYLWSKKLANVPTRVIDVEGKVIVENKQETIKGIFEQ